MVSAVGTAVHAGLLTPLRQELATVHFAGPWLLTCSWKKSRMASDVCLSQVPIYPALPPSAPISSSGSLTYQALPKFMAPRQRGLTRTAAVGESILYRARRLLGGGAAGAGLVMTAIGGRICETDMLW